MSVLSERLANRYKEKYGKQDGRRLNAGEVTELVYSHDIKQLRELISDYLHRKESVWVLFDNLDKGWSTQGVDLIDATILRCLVDAGRKVEREMRKEGNVVHCIVFVRNDVYDHLMRNTPDFGKEMRATLDWNDTDLLREMLRLRLVSGMDAGHARATFGDVWRELCISHYRGEETSSYLIRRTLMRPRNLLKIFNHCRGFATNFNRDIISDLDIEKGLRTYSSDLLQELDAELTQVFPAAQDLLYHFMDSKKALSLADLNKIFDTAGIEKTDHKRLLDFLLYYGVIGIKIGEDEYFIFDVNYDLKVLEIRAARAGSSALYPINPAFWPAFGMPDD